MIDTPQPPIDGVRWRERVFEHGPLRHLINTESHDNVARGVLYAVQQPSQVDISAPNAPRKLGACSGDLKRRNEGAA